MESVRAGFCCITNPFNSRQTTRVSLTAEDVDVIVFWTKNPEPIMKHLDELDSIGYRFYFQFTVNDYPLELEPHVPSLNYRLDTFIKLSDRIGSDRVIWRYDPIVISRLTPVEYHLEHFHKLSQSLECYTKRVIISLVDEYRQASKRLNSLDIGYLEASIDNPGMEDLLCSISQNARDTGMEIYSCAEPWDLSAYGIPPGKCIDDTYIQSVFGINVSPEKDKYQRSECGCIKSKDIGTYNTCKHNCQYCYATRKKT